MIITQIPMQNNTYINDSKSYFTKISKILDKEKKKETFLY